MANDCYLTRRGGGAQGRALMGTPALIVYFPDTTQTCTCIFTTGSVQHKTTINPKNSTFSVFKGRSATDGWNVTAVLADGTQLNKTGQFSIDNQIITVVLSTAIDVFDMTGVTGESQKQQRFNSWYHHDGAFVNNPSGSQQIQVANTIQQYNNELNLLFYTHYIAGGTYGGDYIQAMISKDSYTLSSFQTLNIDFRGLIYDGGYPNICIFAARTDELQIRQTNIQNNPPEGELLPLLRYYDVNGIELTTSSGYQHYTNSTIPVPVETIATIGEGTSRSHDLICDDTTGVYKIADIIWDWTGESHPSYGKNVYYLYHNNNRQTSFTTISKNTSGSFTLSLNLSEVFPSTENATQKYHIGFFAHTANYGEPDKVYAFDGEVKAYIHKIRLE